MVAVSRFRQVGWAVMVSVSFALLLALTFKVNAVKSQVRLTERHIIAAQRAKLMLETEFQTRASQRQLAEWNEVEFGYGAPRADQYLENERQLAMLGAPRGRGAPSPIRVAQAAPAHPAEDASLLGDLIETATDDHAEHGKHAEAEGEHLAASLAQRLARPSAAMVAVADVPE